MQYPNLGEILISGLENRNILYLFVSGKLNEEILSDYVLSCMNLLKELLNTMEITSIRLAKTSNMLDATVWLPVCQYLKRYFYENNIKVTVCIGEVKIPNLNDLID